MRLLHWSGPLALCLPCSAFGVKRGVTIDSLVLVLHYDFIGVCMYHNALKVIVHVRTSVECSSMLASLFNSFHLTCFSSVMKS